MRRVRIYASLAERDPRRSVFSWPESPPVRKWTGAGRVALWRPEAWMR